MSNSTEDRLKMLERRVTLLEQRTPVRFGPGPKGLPQRRDKRPLSELIQEAYEKRLKQQEESNA